MNNRTLTDISDNLSQSLPEQANLYYCMAAIKIMLQTHGVDRGIKSILTVLSRLEQTANIAEMPIFAEFEPPEDLEWLDKLLEAGVTTVSCNLEFLMPARRTRYMPGEGKIPFEHFLLVWERAFMLFGRGQVFSNILMTSDEVPLCNQFGSNELQEMVATGVIPLPGPLYPDPASELAKAMLPSIEDQISFVEGTADLLYRENLDPRWALAGCQRNGSYSAINQFYAARVSEITSTPMSKLKGVA